MAGCPRCAIDLIHANPHKKSIVHPNGFKTFESLRAGEKLNLPTKWFDGSLDTRPKAYFAALPHHNGVTPGVGAPNVLTDYSVFDAAAAQVGALAVLSDQPFHDAVEAGATAIDASVQEIGNGKTAPAIYAAPYAQDVRKNTKLARQRNAELQAAIAAGDDQAGFQARNDILHDLSNALVSAQLALQAFYGDAGAPPEVATDIGPATIDPAPEGDVIIGPVTVDPAPPGVDVTIGPATIDPIPVLPAAVAAAAQAAVDAIGADANYCAAVAQVGSRVNSTVHAFKLAWNATNPSSSVPIGTGTYEQATSDAIKNVIGHAPVACSGARAAPAPSIPAPTPLVVPPQAPGIGVAGVLGLGLLGAGAVGGVIYLATRAHSKSRVRRVNASSDHCGYRLNYGNGQVSSKFSTIAKARAELAADLSFNPGGAPPFIEFKDCDTQDWFRLRGRK